MTLDEAIAGRSSVREYTGQRLDDAAIAMLLDAAVRAPTAMHAESWRFVVVQDEARLARLSDRAKLLLDDRARRLHERPGRRGPEVFSKPDFSIFYNAGTLLVICADAGNPFGAADCWLAAENLMLKAHAMRLGTCVIGSAVSALNEPDIKAELGIPASHAAVAPIIVGTPVHEGSPTARRDPEVLARR
ncbi:MAG: nitroreductase family protein [Proteobacteria bacterium]|nr:nitroreductase family protein [Pseudomonadota bacterium]